MNRLPLILVMVGIFLSLFNIRFGLIIWALSPLVIYILIAYILRKELKYWLVFALLIAIIISLSLIYSQGFH